MSNGFSPNDGTENAERFNAYLGGEVTGEKVEKQPRGQFLTIAYVGVLLFCCLYFYRPEEFVPGLKAVPLAKIAGILTGAALVGAIVSGQVRLTVEIKLVLALFGYLCLCIPGSFWPGGSFEVVITGFSKYVLVAVAAMAALTTVTRLRRLMWVQTSAMLVLALVALAKGMSAGRLWGAGEMFSDPNDFALNLCIILPFCVAFLLSARSWVWRLFWIGAAGVVVLAVVSTYSRGGFLALVAVILAIWRMFRVRRGPAGLLIILSIFVVSAIAFVGLSSYLDRMRTITNTAADETGSAEERQQLLVRSLELSLKHPLFGVGPGQFTELSGAWHQTHNSYTQLTSEAGIPSLLLFLALIWRGFKNLRPFRKTAERSEAWYLANGVFCAVIAYLFGGFFLTTAFWLIPYLLVAYSVTFTRVPKLTCAPMIPKRPAELVAHANGTFQAGIECER